MTLQSENQPLEKALQKYLLEAAALRTSLSPWPNTPRLPFYVRRQYRFFTGQLWTTPVLFMLHTQQEENTADAIAKQILTIQKQWSGPAVYVREQISAHQRRRLIAGWVPFVIPGKQMFLPPLGIDLQESFPQRTAPRDLVDPSTQVLILNGIQHGQVETTLGLAARGLGSPR